MITVEEVCFFVEVEAWHIASETLSHHLQRRMHFKIIIVHFSVERQFSLTTAFRNHEWKFSVCSFNAHRLLLNDYYLLATYTTSIRSIGLSMNLEICDRWRNCFICRRPRNYPIQTSADIWMNESVNGSVMKQRMRKSTGFPNSLDNHFMKFITPTYFSLLRTKFHFFVSRTQW